MLLATLLALQLMQSANPPRVLLGLASAGDPAVAALIPSLGRDTCTVQEPYRTVCVDFAYRQDPRTLDTAAKAGGAASLAECVSDTCVAGLGRALNAQFVVGVTVRGDKEKLEISLRTVDVETAKSTPGPVLQGSFKALHQTELREAVRALLRTLPTDVKPLTNPPKPREQGLTVAREVAPGARLPVEWFVPGAGATIPMEIWMQPLGGTAAQRQWLRSDGTWTEKVTQFDAENPGSIAAVAAGKEAGAWKLVAAHRQDGQMLLLGTRHFLVAAKPFLRILPHAKMMLQESAIVPFLACRGDAKEPINAYARATRAGYPPIQLDPANMMHHESVHLDAVPAGAYTIDVELVNIRTGAVVARDSTEVVVKSRADFAAEGRVVRLGTVRDSQTRHVLEMVLSTRSDVLLDAANPAASVVDAEWDETGLGVLKLTLMKQDRQVRAAIRREVCPPPDNRIGATFDGVGDLLRAAKLTDSPPKPAGCKEAPAQ